MKSLAAAALLLAPLAAPAAQQPESATYARALAAFNAGDVQGAAPLFYELSESARDREVRAHAEYYLGQSLVRAGLPASALIPWANVVRAGARHPHLLEAVEGLVAVQEALQEVNLVPNLLAQAYGEEQRDAWTRLPPESLARVNYLVGMVGQRRARFEEARSLLEAVPATSRVWARARYLLGVVLADPRFPGRPAEAQALDRAALEAFRAVVELREGADRQLDLPEVRQLALLGLGRVHYRRREYPEASAAYERLPRLSRYWDQALFENGFVRFQNEDFGGALGSLQALHAPQYEAAFQPESWILKATIYNFSCLYEEAKTALAAFDALYEPMYARLQPVLAEGSDLGRAYELVAAPDQGQLPRPVYLWARSNERIQGVMRLVAQIDQEKKRLGEAAAWQGSRLAQEMVAALDENRATLLQIGGTLAKSRLQEAADNLRGFSGQAEIIRVQTALDEKELLEAGVDQRRLLSQQPLYRPPMPGADWNYWKFQGEFWIDEIGYYRYTLKRGCPAPREE